MRTDEITGRSITTTEGSDVVPAGVVPAAPVEPTRNMLRKRLGNVYRSGGPYYLAAYSVRWLIANILEMTDRHLVTIEQKKCLVAPWTISARRYTTDENKSLWNRFDWTGRGERWTKSPDWKERILQELMLPNLVEGGTAVEIGPGGGRWTDVLRQRCSKVHVVDVSERALEICRERFADSTNIEYHITEGSRIEVPDATIDSIWSYDVFVHIDPVTTRSYFREFQRVLKPASRAVIHHPGPALSRLKQARRDAWRSELTDRMVARFAEEFGLRLVLQSNELVIQEYDTVSILEKQA